MPRPGHEHVFVHVGVQLLSKGRSRHVPCRHVLHSERSTLLREHRVLCGERLPGEWDLPVRRGGARSALAAVHFVIDRVANRPQWPSAKDASPGLEERQRLLRRMLFERRIEGVGAQRFFDAIVLRVEDRKVTRPRLHEAVGIPVRFSVPTDDSQKRRAVVGASYDGRIIGRWTSSSPGRGSFGGDFCSRAAGGMPGSPRATYKVVSAPPSTVDARRSQYGSASIERQVPLRAWGTFAR